MRFVFLTPGTGAFYCGSCVRDHALTGCLRELGHDVIHVPLYLPHLVDGEDDSAGQPIFFGGVNVYLQERIPAFRQTPEWLDRWLDAKWLLKKIAHRGASTSPHDLGALTHSMLLGARGHQAKELRKLATWLARPENRPDVIALSNLLLIGMASGLRESSGARILCSLQGEESFLQELPEPWRARCWEALRADLGDVDAYLSPSRWFAEVMRGHLGEGLAPLHLLPNGVPPSPTGPMRASGGPVVIGYLARLCELKGLPELVEAFLALCNRPGLPPLELHLAGTTTANDAALIARLQSRIAEAGRAAQVVWRPDLPGQEKARFLAGCDLLSVPALYGEAFGLYLPEAWAAGVPTVQPQHAAFPELTEASGAGWVYDQTRPGALADALEAAILDVEGRTKRAEAGRRAVAGPFSLGRMAEKFVGIAQGVVEPSLS